MEQLWMALEKEVAGKNTRGIQKRLIFPGANISMFCGIEIPSFKRLFIIQMPVELIPSNEVLPQSRGFTVRKEKHGDEPLGLGTLVIGVTGSDCNDLFSSLVRDLVNHISGKKDYSKVVGALLERLGRWQHFLDKANDGGIGEEAQRGLYGELWFLREILLKNVNPLIALASWTGPGGLPQDYQLPSCLVEVKTTIAKQHQKLRISNERQLDDSNTEALFIFHLSLEATHNQGETLVTIVSGIRNQLKESPASQVFEDLLFDTGYLDLHKNKYLKIGYSKREANFFQVREGFPRIIERDLPVGVGDIKYSISIAECKHHSVEESKFLSMIAGENNA